MATRRVDKIAEVWSEMGQLDADLADLVASIGDRYTEHSTAASGTGPAELTPNQEIGPTVRPAIVDLRARCDVIDRHVRRSRFWLARSRYYACMDYLAMARLALDRLQDWSAGDAAAMLQFANNISELDKRREDASTLLATL